VLSGVLERQGAAAHGSFQELFIQAFRWMVLARTLDEKFASLYRAGKIPGGGAYLGRGQEAVSVATGISLKKGDVFAPLIRDGAGRLAFGETPFEAVRTCLGSPLGPMRARDGNVHRGKPREGYLPMISHLGAMISVVNGTLMAHRFKGKSGTVGAASIGEGGTSTGAWHEALNQAAVEKLPLVLVVADNQYAYSTPSSRQFACRSLVDRAAGYGVEGHSVDGTDLGECLNVIGGAVERARGGRGPQLVVAKLLRLCGHGEHDDASYVSAKLKCLPLARDCMDVAREELVENDWANAAQIEDWRAQASAQVEETVNIVQREAAPDPAREQWCALAAKHLAEGAKQE
jgi:acetoin:2,6-dichlorophenolindophenol oxidoreductase subunit alpha